MTLPLPELERVELDVLPGRRVEADLEIRVHTRDGIYRVPVTAGKVELWVPEDGLRGLDLALVSGRSDAVWHPPARDSVPKTLDTPLGSLRGTLVDTSGSPVPDYQFTLLRGGRDTVSLRLVTDSQGSFALSDLPTGTYRASLKVQAEITVREGRKTEATLEYTGPPLR